MTHDELVSELKCIQIALEEGYSAAARTAVDRVLYRLQNERQ